MRINIIVKILLVNGVLTIPSSILAWTVSQKGETNSEISQLVSTKNEVPAVIREIREATLPSKSIQSAAFRGVVDVQPMKLTLEERISNEYQNALMLLKNHEEHQAEAILNKNLEQLPTHHLSRVELATLYLKKYKHEDAIIILQEGLRLEESHPEYLRLLAIISDRNDEPEKALALLMKVKESHRHEDSYASFLGHIYQALGKYSLARQQYFKLLQRDPQNTLWLLGVSVALDAEGKRDAALEGYRRLNNQENFEPDVQQYIKDRIQNLKG